ncbi:MAG: TniB family NTP-binding protein [Bacteroidetes bacterium]|nr:TniB family NTP-binding protein [Bacteroidota bacterium]
MQHLTNNTRDFLEKSNPERISFIRGYKWIGYTRAKEALKKFEDLLTQPPIPRMPNLLLIGEGNNGKTNLVERFQMNHQARIDEQQDKVVAKVMTIDAPAEADEKRLYERILQASYTPYRSNHKAEILKTQACEVLKSLELRVLIIDEIHHVLAGKIGNRQIFLNALKTLGNTLKISVIAVGTKNAFHVFQSDPQMASRFEPFPLPRWQMDTEYQRFLVSYEKLLPLKNPSNLVDRAVASKILSLTDGTIGGIARVLQTAAIDAIEQGTEKITLDILQSLKVPLPEDRNRMPVV